jgi:HAE1 family hydrophobic/amphiphilic exporter-1
MILSVSDFFIRRPIFATVCSTLILLLGGLCIFLLPISQYPEIAPPRVVVSANYTGANAEVVESTVTNILERELNGVEGLRYVASTSANNGSSSINLTFETGRNKDLAAVDVQNRVSAVLSRLPGPVQQTGVRVTKESSGFIFAIGVFSDRDAQQQPLYNDIYLSNYADLYLVNAIRRVKGVGNVQIFGQREYAMRLWLDPLRMAARELTPQDVTQAIRSQNVQVGAGQIGQEPAVPGQLYQLSVSARGRLESEEEFGQIVIRTNPDGTLVRLADVGRVELGAENYGSVLRFNGQDSVGLGVSQLPNANALDVGREVQRTLKELAPSFPPGLRYEIAFDTTRFIEAGAREVVGSLLMAVVLVVLILYVFLQTWQSTVIPSIVIPIALVGTFLFVKLLDFNINTLTLFGLTLASGLVVDDAIVIVEDISRRIEEGQSPMAAAIASMNELASAVVATSLVLVAIFVPVAFFPGATGLLYRQFALTIAFSIVVSTFNALTFTPTLSAVLLRQRTGRVHPFFAMVNGAVEATRRGYAWLLGQLTHHRAVVMGCFALGIAATVVVFLNTPTAFLPVEDQGYFITIVEAPEGVSLNYTRQVLTQIEQAMLQPLRDESGAVVLDDQGQPRRRFPEITNTFAIGGFSFSGPTPNKGIVFTTLRPWEERTGANQSATALIGQLFPQLFGIREAIVVPFPPPAILGLGDVGGFEYQLLDVGNRGFGEMGNALGGLLGAASTFPSPQAPKLVGLRPEFSANTPQLTLEVNRDRANVLQVPLEDIFGTLQTFLGSEYVNDFELFGRAYRVYVQADAPFRSSPEAINKLYVRSRQGAMVSLGNLVTIQETTAPSVITHFNLARSIKITGNAAPGTSSGEVLGILESLSQRVLPPGFSYAWSGLSLEEKESGGQSLLIFGFGLVLVFFVLAAQYENYLDPLIIMITVPLAILGAMVAIQLRGLPSDVYVQIGLVMLIGLASKNSILIVEFANQLRQEGLSITKAAVEASQQRLRPILMTVLSTVIGVLPLAIATGAGAAARISLGTAVIGGMLVATFLSLLITPTLYIVFKGLFAREVPHALPPS